MSHGRSQEATPSQCRSYGASKDNSGNTSGTWAIECRLPLWGGRDAVNAFKGKAEFLDTKKVASVNSAVALLNSFDTTSLRDLCVVWSESSNMYFLLFRRTKQTAIAASGVHAETDLRTTSAEVFLQLEGVDGMTNNCVLFIADDSCQRRNCIVVYFPGDMQECTADEMNTHRQSIYDRYNLQVTSRMIAAKHNAKYCLCVRASKLTAGTYAGYANFCPSWESERNSIPAYDGRTGRGTEHLAAMLDNAPVPPACADAELEFVGFSRGVVVLNQLIAELAQRPNDVAVERVWRRVRAVHHVDGGNQGPVYPLPEDCVCALQSWGSLACMELSWHVHYTPYTFKAGRPYKELEHNAFIDEVLPHAGNILHVKSYFGPDSSLDEHFKCLEEYCVPDARAERRCPSKRCPMDMSGNNCDMWCIECRLPLGGRDAVNAFKGKAEFLDTKKVASANSAVALLNSFDTTSLRDLCVVWSESSNMYFLLFRRTKQTAIAASGVHAETDVHGTCSEGILHLES